MKNLTPEQLEKVCRAVCVARGLDPDKMIWSNEVWGDIIQWSTLVIEVLDRVRALQIDAAIRDNIND